MINQLSIAVLPFVNMSSSIEAEYFSDGMTEEIINALTKIEGLKVTARTSSFVFKNKNIDVRSIANQLNVSTILEGSIRRAGNDLRITAQLIRAEDGFHMFSKNFDRKLDDIFALQDEVSMLIAEQIRENFGHLELPDKLVEAPTKNIAAYDDYLKGLHHQFKWNKEDMFVAAKHYEHSIDKDPCFTRPYLGASQSYNLLATSEFIPQEEGFKKATNIIQKALPLYKDLPNTCFFLSAQSLWTKWDFNEAYLYNTHAIKLKPSFSIAHKTLAEMYAAMGNFDKAMNHAEIALSINPLSPGHLYTKGIVHYLTKNYAKAIELMNSILAIDPHWKLAEEVILACGVLKKDSAKLDEFLKYNFPNISPKDGRHLFEFNNWEIAVDLTEDRSLEEMQQQDGVTKSVIPWNVYFQVYKGNHALALDILEEGVQNRIPQYINFKHDPFLEPLREYSRYQQLIKTIFNENNLPDEDAQNKLVASRNNSLLNENETHKYLASINTLMEDEKVYLIPDLSLKSLADYMTLHPNKLSWLLNKNIGQNFNEYVNTYRLEDFKVNAVNPDKSDITLLGLAYESGFQSKSVFNSVFKKSTGMTPKAWLKSAVA